MKILLLTYIDIGGAARATRKIHNALSSLGHTTRILVDIKKTNFSYIESIEGLYNKINRIIKPQFREYFVKLQRTENEDLHNPCLIPSKIINKINNSDYDIVQLNWICDLISIEQISKIKKPLVWRFSDMWPICGSEHYVEQSLHNRWIEGYSTNNRPNNSSGLDIDKWCWLRKKNNWTKPIPIIAPSNWMAERVKKSKLMKSWPTKVIPTPIDTKKFINFDKNFSRERIKIFDKNFSREKIKIDDFSKIILIGFESSSLGIRYKRKGWHLIEKKIIKYLDDNTNTALLYFGSSINHYPNNKQILHYGEIKDDYKLSLLYSAADVFLIPSLIDTLPQTGLESLSCGCPVVTFKNTTGLSDIIKHKENGYLSDKDDIKDFINGIDYFLNSKNSLKLREVCRKTAENNFSNEIVALKFIDYYKEIISSYSGKKIAFDNQIFSIQQVGGISRYFVCLIQQLNNLGVEAKIFSPINYNNHLQEIPNNLKFGKYLGKYPTKTYRLINIFSKYFSNYLIKKWKPDIIHETYYSSIDFNSNKSIKVLTVFDMIHEVFLGKFFDKNDPNIQRKIKSIKRADHIISVSENTKRDLIEFYPETKNKITVINLGFDFFNINHNDDNLKIQKKNPYILYVGERNVIKNFKNFIKAFSNSNFLKDNFDVVIFGNNKITNEENTLFKELNIENNIIYISGNDSALSKCYSQADLFIYPSLYEGFGLPLLESMGYECPVVCSDNSSLPEVAGNAAIYFNPYDIESIQFAIEKVLKDKELQFDMIKKGLNRCNKFTWKKNAEETLSLYNRLLK